jgi:hypothetical protein
MIWRRKSPLSLFSKHGLRSGYKAATPNNTIASARLKGSPGIPSRASERHEAKLVLREHNNCFTIEKPRPRSQGFVNTLGF